MTVHGKLVDRYELHGILGRGGMAEVRDAWDTRLNRPVAVKLLHPVLGADPDIRRRFEDEARSAARLSHQNIVVVFDFGVHDGTPFIVLERLPGQTLADLIAAGLMPPQHVRAMVADVLAGLHAAHSAGILHRDIKPGNILVSALGDAVKVADFGIAKTGDSAHTTTNQVIGTMSYLSPERIAGAPASVSDDLYAVGLMAYEALLGRRLFSQDNPAALARAVIDNPPPPVATMRPDADPFLAAVIDRAISRNPVQRFGSAAQMGAALAGDRSALFDATAPVAASPRPVTKVLPGPPVPATPYYAAPPRRRRGKTAMYASAVAVLLALAVSAVAMAMEPSPTMPPPQPVGTSVPVVPPATVAPPPPPPSPVVQPPGPKTEDDPGGRGHGRGDKKRG